MISVIIPVLNEGKTIGNIVRFLKEQPEVGEIIVVDDKSFDDTVFEAKKAGAIVVNTTKLGKGASMKDGLLISKGDVIVYLDGDVEKYDIDVIKVLTDPIVSDEADFVKGTFDREAGRVTGLVAKPLLSLLVPELTVFNQPLSGMIAGRKSFFEKIQFENDYGVDIGILIDMYNMKARIKEVGLGRIDHKMKSWQQLGKMAREVSRAILKRAPLNSYKNLDYLGIIDLLRDQMDYSVKEALLGLKKMALFDMDNTLLRGSFINTAALKLGFSEKLKRIRAQNNDEMVTTKMVAKLLKGIRLNQIIEIADLIPMADGVEITIKKLKERGYVTGILSHSYDCVTEHIKNKIGADFTLAHVLEFSDSVATGEVNIPSFFIHRENGICSHNICKTNAILELIARYGIALANVVMVGDDARDECAIRHAGIGVAFCSKEAGLNYAADRCIKRRTLKPILAFAN